MSGHIGDAIATAVPAVGAAGTGYATDINLLLAEFKARLIELLPNASIVWSTDADIDGAGLLNVGTLTLTDVATVPASPTAAIVYSAGEFYLVTASGAIQVTASGALNIAATGGIGGDYGGADPAIVTYVSADGIYNFMTDPASFANIGVEALHVWNAAQTFKSVVTLAAGSVADTVFALPPTQVPGGGSRALLSLGNDGTVDHDQSVSIVQAFSVDLDLTGTAKVRHGSRTLVAAAYNGFHQRVGTVTKSAAGDLVTVAASSTGFFPLPPLPVGSRITAIGVYVSSGAGDYSLALYSSVPGYTLIGAAATGAGSVAGTWISKTGLTATIAADTLYGINLAETGGAAGLAIALIRVVYDQPA